MIPETEKIPQHSVKRDSEQGEVGNDPCRAGHKDQCGDRGGKALQELGNIWKTSAQTDFVISVPIGAQECEAELHHDPNKAEMLQEVRGGLIPIPVLWPKAGSHLVYGQ